MNDIEKIYSARLYEAEMMLERARQLPDGSFNREYWLYAAEKATEEAEGAKKVIHLLRNHVAIVLDN